MMPITVYGDSISGNCYKVQLACAELGIDYRWQEVDTLAGETRTPEFLTMNPNGKIPVAAIGDGRYLAESLFAYTHVADEGGFDLAPYSSVLAWLERVRSRPRFVPMNA